MDHFRIASRLVEARRKKLAEPVAEPVLESPESMLKPSTEYSCRMEISLSADFEGDASKRDLVKKMKNEVIAAIKSGIEQVSKDLGLRGTGVVVKPLQVECAVNDQADMADDEESSGDADEFVEPAPAPKRRKRR